MKLVNLRRDIHLPIMFVMTLGMSVPMFGDQTRNCTTVSVAEQFLESISVPPCLQKEEHAFMYTYNPIYGAVEMVGSFFGFRSPIADAIRFEYNAAVDALRADFLNLAAQAHKARQSLDQIALRRVSEARNQIKKHFRNATPSLGRWMIYARNFYAYGSMEGPGDFAAMVASESKKPKGKSPEEIAYSALGTDGGDLNLANNGFKTVLAVYKDLKNVMGDPAHTGLYPEAITPDAAQCYLQKMEVAKAQDSVAVKGILQDCQIVGLFGND